MTRLEDCCATCDTQGCSTVVCLDAHPEALRDCCNEVVCEGCETCDCALGGAA